MDVKKNLIDAFGQYGFLGYINSHSDVGNKGLRRIIISEELTRNPTKKEEYVEMAKTQLLLGAANGIDEKLVNTISKHYKCSVSTKKKYSDSNKFMYLLNRAQNRLPMKNKCILISPTKYFKIADSDIGSLLEFNFKDLGVVFFKGLRLFTSTHVNDKEGFLLTDDCCSIDIWEPSIIVEKDSRSGDLDVDLSYRDKVFIDPNRIVKIKF
jgi:hypothetical protein